MAQQVVKAVCHLPSLDSNVDAMTFSTHWEQVGSNTLVNQTTINNAIIAFLNTVATGATLTVAKRLSSVLSRAANAASILLYDITGHLNGTPAGSPIAVTNFTLGAADSFNGMPEELALVISYQCAYGTDVEFGPHTRPRARDRNRFYVGPLCQTAIANDATTKASFIATAVTTDVVKAAQTLLTPATGTTDVTTPVVWSRVAAAVKQPITLVWTNSQYGVQRRRVDPRAKIFA